MRQLNRAINVFAAASHLHDRGLARGLSGGGRADGCEVHVEVFPSAPLVFAPLLSRMKAISVCPKKNAFDASSERGSTGGPIPCRRARRRKAEETLQLLAGVFLDGPHAVCSVFCFDN